MSVSFVDNELHLYPEYIVFMRKGRWSGNGGLGRGLECWELAAVYTTILIKYILYPLTAFPSSLFNRE